MDKLINKYRHHKPLRSLVLSKCVLQLYSCQPQSETMILIGQLACLSSYLTAKGSTEDFKQVNQCIHSLLNSQRRWPVRICNVISLNYCLDSRYLCAHLFLRSGDLDLDLDLDLLPLQLHGPAHKQDKISEVHLLDQFTCISMFLAMLMDD